MMSRYDSPGLSGICWWLEVGWWFEFKTAYLIFKTCGDARKFNDNDDVRFDFSSFDISKMSNQSQKSTIP
jgi:hypothetical protein